MNITSIKRQVAKMMATVKPRIPTYGLLVKVFDGESDESALERALAEHPQGEQWRKLREDGTRPPMMYFRLRGLIRDTDD